MSTNVSRLIPGSHKRAAIIAGAAVVVVAVVAGSIFYYSWVNSFRADLILAKGSRQVRITDPVTVQFTRQVDGSHIDVKVKPATQITVKRLRDRLVITPVGGRWTPNQTYTLVLSAVPDQTHTSTIKGWQATFSTQPHVGVAGAKVDGQPLGEGSMLAPGTNIDISFTSAMKPASVVLTLNGGPLPANQITWNKEGTGVRFTLPRNLSPYAPLKLGINANAVTAKGEPITDPWSLGIGIEPVMPANPSSGIGPGFKTLPPIMIVIENSGAARPQSGLQNADMVWEYISEYSITRMTAVYFNQPPGQIGPVRSCRMINQYLAYGFGGYTLCSGASVGTLNQIFTHNYTGFSINDFDTGSHFRRVGFMAAPHNLYTDAGDANRMRGERAPNPTSPYFIDPTHPDIDMGVPADAPQIPPHSVGYAYDPSSASYLRFDHGTPFTEAGGGQVRVKNVVIVHVNYHMAGWVEDENGGAGSVWYDMTGDGPAEIYSDGKVVHGAWHMGAGGQNYSDLHQPMFFTDDQGNIVRLNSGLTWLHVLGNGQAG